jgi:protein tyrosine phosphatase (PTP) superfamily phosphohydrolase (DUF442 family)
MTFSPGQFYDRLLLRLYNIRRVDEQIYRSSQLYGHHLRRVLKHLGIRTLLNLRGPQSGGWYKNEETACDELGIRFISLSLSSRKLPRAELLEELLEILETAPRPVIMKCSGGADRTSLISGLYLMQKAFTETTRADPKAIADIGRDQARYFPHLHFPFKQQRWIRIFFDFYQADHQGLSPRDWLRQRYSQERFKQYMQSRGCHDYWKEPGRGTP